jgi:hypothetical protein
VAAPRRRRETFGAVHGEGACARESVQGRSRGT